VEAEITAWDKLGLSQAALELIHKSGFKTPSPVQAESIPIALSGSDLIASAQTGTGKTASFVLPMVDKFVGREGTFGLILCPTREIAQQTRF
jgi:ATP-dependent RNA helicase RhlE